MFVSEEKKKRKEKENHTKKAKEEEERKSEEIKQNRQHRLLPTYIHCMAEATDEDSLAHQDKDYYSLTRTHVHTTYMCITSSCLLTNVSLYVCVLFLFFVSCCRRVVV